MSKCNNAIKSRIYPNHGQQVLINKTFGCTRKVWNLMLADRNVAYNENKEIVLPRPAQYKEDYPYLKEVDSLALANVQLHQEKAFRDFYKGLKKKGKNKHYKPKFKSKKKSKRSYTTNVVGDNIFIADGKLRLPKVGMVKIVLSKPIDPQHTLKSVTISQNSKGDYFASLLFEYDNDVQIKPLGECTTIIGLDYKSDGLYTDSNGQCADMPHFYRQSQRKLARQQRRLVKKQGFRKGETPSHNFYKQMHRVNTIYCKSANQRKDFLHKRSTEITNQYDIVCVEDLDLKAISNKKGRKGKSTMDNGYGMFVQMLAYKQERKGHYLIKVDRWFPSSQLCHECGSKDPQMKDLSRRIYDCPVCGCRIDRDWNAAINIKNEGYSLLTI